MPRISRRTPKARQGARVEDIECLCRGGYIIRLGDHEMTTPERRALWSDHGDAITVLHSEHYPHTRPAAWWQCTAPERRRRVNGVHPHENPARNPALSRELFYGMPSALQLDDDFQAEFESQADYIDRLTLWLPGERTRPAWEPGDDDDSEPSLSMGVIHAWWDAQRA